MESEKWFLVYLVAFFLVLLVSAPLTSLGADEGTHSLLAVFYKDLITSTIENGVVSFQKLYDFGISYLTHYPKLQVFYPPIYHLTTGLVFYNVLGISEFSSRLCNITFGIMSLVLLFIVVKKFFDSKTALSTVILFSLLPFTLTLANKSMMDSTAMFFLILSLVAYLESMKSGKTSHYILTALISSLAAMSKRIAAFVIFVYIIHLMIQKKWKFAVVLLVSFVLFISPYMFLIWKTGGFEISQVIYSSYAFETVAWYSFFEFPFLIVFVCVFIYYIFKNRDKNKRLDKWLLMLWFFVFLFGVVFLSFKPKYFIYFLVPLMMVSANYLSKTKKLNIAFLILYIGLSLSFVVPNIVYYPAEETSREIYSSIEHGGNVAMISEGDNFYSSVLMFYLSKLDNGKNIFVYRPCVFLEKDGNETLDFFKENNVYYVVAVSGEDGYEKIAEIGNRLTQVKGGYVEVYVFEGFEYKEKEEYCNYVCLTEEEICTTYKNPFDIF